MDEWIEFTHTNAPLLSRSLQPTHIFFRGDRFLAQQKLGVARKILGYVEFDQSIGQLGFAAKLVTLSDGTLIRAICHGAQRSILIDVHGIKVESTLPPVHGYQFYTTTPSPVFLECDDSYSPAGSAVFARIPKYDPANPVDPTTVELNAVPTGSFVDIPPAPVPGVRQPTWVYYDFYTTILNNQNLPTCELKQSKLNQLMQQILMVSGSWQINGIAEYVSYHGDDFTNTVMANPALHQSWVQGDLSNSFGLKTVLSPGEFTDQYYDAAPSLVGPWDKSGPPNLKTKVPDSDWFGRAALRSETHPIYGVRQFIILSAADGRFHCWPLNAPLGGDYSAEYGAYGWQAYKGNVVKEYAKSMVPAYPDWVHNPNGAFRDFSKPDEALLTPRYTWAFNQDGTRAISVMMERKSTEGAFSKINYAPNGLGWAVFDALNNEWDTRTTVSCFNGDCTTIVEHPYQLDPNRSHVPLTPPSEVDVAPLQVKPTANSTEFSEIHVDRFGYVELEFTINITGPELKDFDLGISVIKSGEPEHVNTIEHGFLVDVAYAKPLAWNHWATLNKMGKKIGVGTGDSIDNIRIDDVLCLFIKAYRHADQTVVLDAYDGEVTLPDPSKVKAMFGKGYPADHSNILTLPLAQTHGRGYTYSPDEELLPPEPHKHVYRPDQTFGSEYPFSPEDITEQSKIHYIYKAKITDLDLGALAFYYHVRCVAQEHKDETIPLQSSVKDSSTGTPLFYDWHPIEYKARSWCSVVVMGRVADEVSIGPADIPLAWLQGWVYQGGALALDTAEALIDPNEQRAFRGFGQQQSPLYPMRARRTSYSGTNFTTQQRQEHRFVSYRQVFSLEDPTTREITWNFQESPYFELHLRPLIYNYFHGVMPWFLCGACAAIVDFALLILYRTSYGLKTHYSASGGFEINNPFFTQNFSIEAAIHWRPAIGINLYELTESSTYDFMLYVFNLYNQFVQTETGSSSGFIQERNGDGSIIYTSTSSLEYDSQLSISEWLTESPFSAANKSITAEQFAQATYKYFWRLVKYFQSIGPMDTMAPVVEFPDPYYDVNINPTGFVNSLWNLTDGFFYNITLEPRCPPHQYVLPRGSGAVRLDYNRVYPYIYPFVELHKSQYIIRDFEYGNLVYTHLLHTHFSPVINDATSFIRITPEGHFSYCKQDIFEFNRAMIPEAVFYADYIGPTEQRTGSFSRTPGVAIPWGIEHVGLPHYTNELTKDDIEWQPLEGVGWFYGALRCSHLELYEKAYHTPPDEKRYYHDQPVKPDATEYKPEFKLFSAPEFDGYLVNPVQGYDDRAYDWRYWIYPWGQPPHALISSQFMYPEYNQDRKYIRLSPLFF